MKICYSLFATEMLIIVLLLLFVSDVSGERVEVTRQIGFKEDKFTIPSLRCKLKKCGDYNGRDAEHPPGCKCTCSDAVSTPGFFFLNGKWQCTSQIDIRNQQDCRFHLIPFENTKRELYTLQSSIELPINLEYKSSMDACKIDVLQSRYMSCNGAWIPLNYTEIKRFELVKPSVPNKSQQLYNIKVNRHVEGFNLDGRVIKLAFSKECSTNINSKNRCMLFKVEGTFKCPLEQLSPPSPQPVTTSKEQFDNGKSKENVKGTMKQSDNSTIDAGIPKKVTNNQDIVFIICGGVALVAVIFIVVIIFNLRRTERRNRRRANAAMAQSVQTYPKPPASHVILVQNVASANGGFNDNASLVTGITDITNHSGSSGYSSDTIATKKEAVQSSNDIEEGVFDPIYENFCEKCKGLNLVGPCEHVESYDSDDGPVYINLADEEESGKDEGEKKQDSEKESKEMSETAVTFSKQIPDEDSQKEKKREEKSSSIKASEKPNSNGQKKSNSKRSRRRRKKQTSTKSETNLKKQSSTEKSVKQDKQDLIGNIEQEHSENEDIGGEHLYDAVDDSDDDDHVYESVCESSDEDDDDDDEREYYNIDEFNDQIDKVKSQSDPDLADSYRDNPPPLPPRPSDDSAEEESSKENKDSKDKKGFPKKPPRNLRKQKSTEQLTDSESEDSPRLPARLYDANEENTSTEKNKTESVSLQSEQIKEKEPSSDNANVITSSLPPRLCDKEEELRANKIFTDKSKERVSNEEGAHNKNSKKIENDSENSLALTKNNENETPL